LAIGAQKLGHPVPESNFVSELKSALSQQMQRRVLVVQVVVLAGEGALGALLARDFKLQRGQLLFPPASVLWTWAT